MSPAITMDGAGRIVLPSEVRRQLNLSAGSRFRLTVVAERIELTPEAEPESELGLTATQRRVLKPTGVAFDATAATRDERAAQARRRGNRSMFMGWRKRSPFSSAEGTAVA